MPGKANRMSHILENMKTKMWICTHTSKPSSSYYFIIIFFFGLVQPCHHFSVWEVRVDFFIVIEKAPVAQWVKRWPTDLGDQVRSPLEAKSFLNHKRS